MSYPHQMKAVLLMGFGGFDKLEYREDVPVPMPAEGEVLAKVGACGVNNTDIWTREGAYGGSVDAAARSGFRGGDFQFPRIQGADIMGSIVAIGESVAKSRIGERVIVNPTLYEDEGEGLFITRAWSAASATVASRSLPRYRHRTRSRFSPISVMPSLRRLWSPT